jgi:hypothetical protein
MTDEAHYGVTFATKYFLDTTHPSWVWAGEENDLRFRIPSLGSARLELRREGVLVDQA